MRLSQIQIGLAAAGLAVAPFGSCSPSSFGAAPTCPTLPPTGTPTPAALLYPIPGASGVPDGNFTLVTSYATELQLVDPPVITIFLGASPGPAPTPLPSPMGSYAPGTPLQGWMVPALYAHTTYTVENQPSSPGFCNKQSVIGTFTTQ